jgi:hypothetical protein
MILMFVDPRTIILFIKKNLTRRNNDVVRPVNVHQLHVQQPFKYEKPEATSAVLGS